MITLTLLHPIKDVPVQKWTFEPDTTIRIGRSTKNDVILYSAVVSRHHLEIRPTDSHWELVNLGTNGTYEIKTGKRINQTIVVDGMIICLAKSGPKIQISLDSEETRQRHGTTEKDDQSTLTQEQVSKDTKDTLIT
ncbi:MAG: FHA domain-containing protein [Gomphosphaeria aponina SAG 52.96 = DSM 107014]|uniref:FHA domain-containing protein n=1 Tax=Gomphosphaeria aponina SAG 52.96 = DSM 107014 TaxID=1521640 RepID=A0A941JS80_9CHRO|nr:FHA domain-containing protein [Gomphosphaeria aponina SAG 52.96 = DSM 107014]